MWHSERHAVSPCGVCAGDFLNLKKRYYAEASLTIHYLRARARKMCVVVPTTHLGKGNPLARSPLHPLRLWPISALSLPEPVNRIAGSIHSQDLETCLSTHTRSMYKRRRLIPATSWPLHHQSGRSCPDTLYRFLITSICP